MNEEQTLAAMREDFRRHGGLIGPTSREGHPWLAAKRAALSTLLLATDPASILDVGIGDRSLWGDGSSLIGRRYVGAEGEPGILAAAAAQAAERGEILSSFELLRLSELRGALEPWRFDLIVCTDVLYHQPSAALQAQLVDFLFLAGKAVLLTYAAPGAGRSAQTGHFWWPQPFPHHQTAPAGWRRLASSEWSDGLHPQVLGAWVRA